MVTFQDEPVQKAGLTGGDWNVSWNVLDGPGPIRTLRISAYSNDFSPLNGKGTLFALRMTRVSKAAQNTQLIWAAPPDQFIFIDANLKTQKPDYAASGGVTLSGATQAKPNDEQTKPKEEQATPNDEQVTPSDKQRSPDDEQAMPKDEQAMPNKDLPSAITAAMFVLPWIKAF